MADSNIKKVIIPKADLPAIDANNFTYNVRYRIVSEDKNRNSHWSRIYTVDASSLIPSTPFPYSYVKETVTTNTGSTTAIRLNWITPVGYTDNTFDIFVKRNFGAYSYYGTAYTNTYVVLRESTETLITILVQMPVYPKIQKLSAKLFETSAITVP